MNQILQDRRCRCKEKFSITKKDKSKTRSQRTFNYPNIDQAPSQTFQIKYEKKFSSTAKAILNSFKYKYIYYAIEDILYLLKENPIERNDLSIG